MHQVGDQTKETTSPIELFVLRLATVVLLTKVVECKETGVGLDEHRSRSGTDTGQSISPDHSMSQVSQLANYL